jgi:AcrR family transcriptional regulator
MLDTHERILSATRALLRQPDGEISLRAVARAANIAPSAVYRHFENKEALIEAITRAAVERFTQSLWRAIAPLPLGSIERLVRLGHEYISFAETHPADYAILFSPSAGRPRPVRQFPNKAGFDILVQCVEEAMEAGAIKRSDPIIVALLLWTRVHGIVQLLGAVDFGAEAVVTRGRNRLHALFDETSRLVFAGLAART